MLLLDALVLLRNHLLQLLAQDIEDLEAFLETVGQLLDDGFHTLVERIRGIEIGGQSHCDLAQSIEHLPRGMSARGEEGLVEDGDLEHRDLQAADEPLHPMGYLGVLENLIEQHRHDVEGGHVHLAHAGANARAFELAQDVGRTGFGRGGRRRQGPARRAEIAVLDARERAKQRCPLEQRLARPVCLAG